MIAALFDNHGRKLMEQKVPSSFFALSFTQLYANWQYVIVVASNGQPCEMFYRL